MKYTRSYPHTNEWKDRTYKPEAAQYWLINSLILIGLILIGAGLFLKAIQ